MSGGIKVWHYLNNDELQYTYKEALEKGITRPAFVRAIDSLISYGFLDIAKQGSGGRERDASLYSLSDRWRKWGTSDFDPGKPRPRDTRKGRGFDVMWKRKRNEESKSIFGNAGVTRTGNTDVTPKPDFEHNFKASSNTSVTPAKAQKRRRSASPMH